MAINRRLRFKIFARDSFTCQYCGRKAPDVELQVDHKYPRAKGGGDEEANLLTACTECNGGKHTLTIPIEYTLKEGPFDGETVKRLDIYPVEWVWRDNAGVYLRLADAMVDDGGESTYTRLIYGPSPLNHPRAVYESVIDRLKTTNDDRRATLIGAYMSYGYYPEFGFPPEMEWFDPARLLLSLDYVEPRMFEPRNPIRG